MATSQHAPQWSTAQFVSNEGISTLPREPLSTVLADMIARKRGVDPTQDGFRLYEYLNPEAVDALFEHSNRWEESSWRLEFDTGDETVVVRSDGFIRVRGRR